MDTKLTIKTDKKLRDNVKKTAKQMGIPLTVAINAMMRQFVRDGVLTLEAECPYPSHTPNAETRRAIRDANKGKNTRSFASMEEFEKYVRAL